MLILCPHMHEERETLYSEIGRVYIDTIVERSNQELQNVFQWLLGCPYGGPGGTAINRFLVNNREIDIKHVLGSATSYNCL